MKPLEKKFDYYLIKWLFILLAWLLNLHGCGAPPKIPVPKNNVKGPISIESLIASESLDIFTKLQIAKVQSEYQKSYLDLIEKINNAESGPIQVKERKDIFNNYSFVFKKYRNVLKQIEDHEKDEKIKCFSVMKSLILAVVYYDKKTKKKMFKYDPQKLIAANVFGEAPKCPNTNGKYFIFYKDGQRFFSCSLHGTLKQR